MDYNAPNYVDVIWTPIEAVNGNYTVDIQLQPKHAILIRREQTNYFKIIYNYFNGTTTATSIAFTVSEPLFVSQQVLYSDGTNYNGSVNYVSKNPNRSISEEYGNGANLSNWLLKFAAKFE